MFSFAVVILKSVSHLESSSGICFQPFNCDNIFNFEMSQLFSLQEAVAYLPFIYLSFAGIGSIAVKPIVKKLKPMVGSLI